MPKYLARVSYTPEGIKGLVKETASNRRAYISKLTESAGGRLETFYFAFGEDDAIVIYEMPDNASAAAVSVAINATAHVSLSITPLMTVEEMDQALGKSVNYRPPGG